MKKTIPSKEQLKSLNIFNLSSDEIKDPCLLEFENGEYIYIEGEELPYLIIILNGDAKVFHSNEHGQTLLLCIFNAGSIIGDLEFFLNVYRAKTTIQALNNVTCMAIPIRTNRSILLNNKEFLYNIGKTIAEKLDRLTINSTTNILKPVEVRLCSYIKTVNKDLYFNENLTEVAEILGTSYRHLLRCISDLSKKGIIEKRKNGYYIVDYNEILKKGGNFYNTIRI